MDSSMDDGDSATSVHQATERLFKVPVVQIAVIYQFCLLVKLIFINSNKHITPGVKKQEAHGC